MNRHHYLKHLCLGIAFSCLAMGCNGGSNGNATSAFPNNPSLTRENLSDVSVVDSKSPYADVLATCTRITRANDSCSLKKLPLIGQEFEKPTIDDVMSRVLVSHPWMGQRFREVLDALPADILTLLKAATAIVIDADIRPSYYGTRTGALYLDPGILWLSNEEKATISKEKDFRNDYSEGLLFEDVWRYVKDNVKAYKNYPLDGNETRELKDILYRVAAVLYHESSHANDIFPVSGREDLNIDETVYQTFMGNMKSIARTLDEKFPLKSEFLYDMAQILIVGMIPGDSQKKINAEEMGVALENDGANDIYNYVSSATSLSVAVLGEDVAMLFEETMMKYHFNVDRDVGFLQDNPLGESCNDFILKWGVRNRIADSRVIERAKLVASMTIPSEDLSGFFQSLGTPQSLLLGVGWCASIDPSGTSGSNTVGVKKMHDSYSVNGEEKLESQLRPGL